jgi:hypothetical protein
MNRVTRVLKPTRTRLHTAAAGAAFALIAGLSAPAVAANAGSAGPVDTAVVQDNVAAAAQTPAKAPAKAAKAPAKAVTVAAKDVAAKNVAAKNDAPKPAAPSAHDLHPVAVSGSQESFTPSAEQIKNARAIVQAGQKMGLPARAWVIAVATSLQESQLKNIGDLGDANDHDSLGLFQQRPSSGWGTPQQITDPNYAATAFYKGLVGVDGWSKMALTDAAQAVQVSAFPDHYAKWENEAGDLVTAVYGSGPYAAQAASAQ